MGALRLLTSIVLLLLAALGAGQVIVFLLPAWSPTAAFLGGVSAVIVICLPWADRVDR